MRHFLRLTCFLLLSIPLLGQGQPPQPGQGLSGFVPIDQLPPASDQVPAAPYLIAAYLFVWLAAIFYILVRLAADGQRSRRNSDAPASSLSKRRFSIQHPSDARTDRGVDRTCAMRHRTG
jgi:hypothetical protein